MSATVQFASDPKDRKLISQIADRYLAMQQEALGSHDAKVYVEMDLAAAHQTNPLRLADLLAADNFNFAHDVGGIAQHLNRETGQLENFFSPRFSARVSA